jgi:hypothetical protein
MVSEEDGYLPPVLHRIAFPVVSEWCQKSPSLPPGPSCLYDIKLIYAESGEPTSGLEPLT